MDAEIIWLSGKLGVVIIWCILRFLWLLSDPTLAVSISISILFVFVFFLVIIFLFLTTWLSPVCLACQVGSLRCLVFLIVIIDVEVNLGFDCMRFQCIRTKLTIS